MRKKLLFLLIVLISLGVNSEVLALETAWPTSPFGTDLTDESNLTDMVRYFYEWGIFIGGLAVFVSLLFGGFLYLTSMGNPARMSEAKERIFSALIGLVLLFSIYIILNIINPELTVLTIPTIMPPSATLKEICEASLFDQDGDYIVDLAPGERWNGGTINGDTEIKSVNIYKGGMECELILYTEKNLEGDSKIITESTDDTGGTFLSAENQEWKFDVSECTKVILYTETGYTGTSIEVIPGSDCKNLEIALAKVVKSVKMEGSCVLYMYKDTDTSCSTDPLFIVGSSIENMESSYGVTDFGSAKIY